MCMDLNVLILRFWLDLSVFRFLFNFLTFFSFLTRFALVLLFHFHFLLFYGFLPAFTTSYHLFSMYLGHVNRDEYRILTMFVFSLKNAPHGEKREKRNMNFLSHFHLFCSLNWKTQLWKRSEGVIFQFRCLQKCQ